MNGIRGTTIRVKLNGHKKDWWPKKGVDQIPSGVGSGPGGGHSSGGASSKSPQNGFFIINTPQIDETAFPGGTPRTIGNPGTPGTSAIINGVYTVPVPFAGTTTGIVTINFLSNVMLGTGIPDRISDQVTITNLTTGTVYTVPLALYGPRPSTMFQVRIPNVAPNTQFQYIVTPGVLGINTDYFSLTFIYSDR